MPVGLYYWISAGVLAVCFYLFFSTLFEGLLKNKTKRKRYFLAAMSSTFGVILVFIVTMVLKT